MSEKISVILPCYNSEKFLRKTIMSVLNQDYDNFELIIIDDGSRDKTQNILNKFSNNKKIIIKKNRKNSGKPSIARNIGLKICSGRYVTFIDSDDTWKKNKLRNQFNFMKKKNIKISHTSYCEKKNNKIINYINANNEISHDSLLKINNIFINTVMIKNPFYLEEFSEKIKIAEDYFFLINNLKKFNTVSMKTEPDEYYVSKTIVSNSVSADKLLAIRCLFFGYKKILKLNNLNAFFLTSKYIIQTVKKKFKRYIF